MSHIKVVFWGTPNFSIPSLNECHTNPRINVVAVVTQPDKPVGRSNKPVSPPIKKIAEGLNIPVFQPSNVKRFRDDLNSIGEFDYNVVVAYGKIIPPSIITHPKHSTINVHPSLLPKYRGPAPIHYALLHGDKETGISIMQIDKELDHGPILKKETVPIQPNDDYASLLESLSKKGAQILVRTLIEFHDGSITPKEQNHTKATYSKLLTKNDGEIEWSESIHNINNKIRALNPWPGTYTFWQGKRLKIIKVKPLTATTLKPGRIAFSENAIYVGTKNGDLQILELQREGKEVQSAEDFMKGNATLAESILPN